MPSDKVQAALSPSLNGGFETYRFPANVNFLYYRNCLLIRLLTHSGICLHTKLLLAYFLPIWHWPKSCATVSQAALLNKKKKKKSQQLRYHLTGGKKFSVLQTVQIGIGANEASRLLRPGGKAPGT
jgi:hypothetical protein